MFKGLGALLALWYFKKMGRDEVVTKNAVKEAELEKEYAQISTDASGVTPTDTAGKLSSGSF